MKRNVVRLLTLFMVVTLVLVAALPANATPSSEAALKAPKSSTGVYIVQMIDAPVVAYTGGTKKLQATAPKTGQKIDPFSPAVGTYVSYLDSTHLKALTAVGGGKKLYDYHFSYNGFAAQLTEAQAIKMASVAGVVAVSPDQTQTIDTSSTPTFLGLDADGGLWDQLGGVGSAGEGIIIGVIDSGIWPESLSFSDRTGENGNATKDGKLSYQQISGWHGKCTPGEDFPASLCNQKLIGAQYFNESWKADGGIDFLRPWEFNSARDYNGHGTHTSSTAGGNFGVEVTGPGSVFHTINGIAPRARIAMYKALWSTQAADTASGSTSDLVAAIDQAVADGVDVINYSISGTLTNFRDPAEIAFLDAARAGIFVAASAGNSGPAVSTVAHPSPWITTVAAGTHNRSVTGSVTLGDKTYAGISLAAMSVTAPIVNSTAVAAAGASATAARLCFSTASNGGVPALDSAKVAGKIVVCDRGTSARVDKSLAVKEAGGVGMVLVNVSSAANSLNADFHSVPTVHLDFVNNLAVHTFAAVAGAQATINQSVISYNAPAPFTADFSSRGPLQASGDLLKPDLIAPGQDILAAVSPAGSGGMNFNLYSGTSMSSPHVAGLAALLKDLNPGWTPMMIKSALMTTGYDVLDGPNTNPLVIFSQGAGHVKPNSAADPGLVFNSNYSDWLGFLCGTQLPTYFCTSNSVPVLDPSNFNGPSIAIAELAGNQTVTRALTNVDVDETYTFSSTGLSGITVATDLSSFKVKQGATQSIKVTFTVTTAPLNSYVGGYLTWTGDKGHVVRIPVVLKPVALAAPAELTSNGSSISYPVTFGYTGSSFTASPVGLVAAQTFDGSINTGQQLTYKVTVPAGTTYARFSLFDANVSPASDLDLVVYNSSEAVVGSSGGGTSAEEVNLRNPAAGDYTVLVDGYATGNPTTFTLFAWVLGSTSAGNMTVSAPTSATLGATGTIQLSFKDLAAKSKYLGSVTYGGAAGMPNPTIVRVDVP